MLRNSRPHLHSSLSPWGQLRHQDRYFVLSGLDPHVSAFPLALRRREHNQNQRRGIESLGERDHLSVQHLGWHCRDIFRLLYFHHGVVSVTNVGLRILFLTAVSHEHFRPVVINNN